MIDDDLQDVVFAEEGDRVSCVNQETIVHFKSTRHVTETLNFLCAVFCQQEGVRAFHR